MKTQVTRLDYCQDLLASQINSTLTNFANHCEQCSHDAINRSLRGEQITPRLIWDNVRAHVVVNERGYVVFDDTMLDKNASCAIELVRRQDSGNAKAVIKGMGVVTCGYVHPDLAQFWLLDYRLYDPDGDGTTKRDHVREMLTNVVYHTQRPFQAGLLETWYATKDWRLCIESLATTSYCPRKDNRQVDDAHEQQPYRRVDALDGDYEALTHGKRIKIKGFPKDHDQRLISGCHRSHTRGVRLSLEDRAVAPRRQTSHGPSSLSERTL